MEYCTLTLNNIPQNLSVIGLGTWAFGGDGWGKVDKSELIATVKTAVDEGINLIDTAPIYGNGVSESIVGEAIKGNRDNLFIATKCGLRSQGKRVWTTLAPDSVREEVELSLRRLDIDVIDLYQCHWPDPKIPIEATLEVLDNLQKEGKIKHYGVSNFKIDLLKKSTEIGQVSTLQAEYSLLKREAEKDTLPFCDTEKMGFLAYGPFAGGILTGKYHQTPKSKPPQFPRGDARSFFYRFYKEPMWSKVSPLVRKIVEEAHKQQVDASHIALAWTMAQKGVTTVLVGAKNPDQIRSNAKAASLTLSENFLRDISDFVLS